MSSKNTFYARVQNAKNLIRDIRDSSNRYYLAVGKCDAWSATDTDFVDGTVPDPSRSLSYENQVRSNFLSMKKVDPINVSHMARNWTWNAANGTVGNNFVAWDSTDENIFEKPFYMYDGQNNVYKCLRKGPGVATVKPTHTTAAVPAAGSDGYVWKFMYSLTSSDGVFRTKEYIPVRTVEYYLGIEQNEVDYPIYQRQQAALNDVGKIYYIKVLNGGSGYSQSSPPAVTIEGDGTGAVANAIVSSGGVVTGFTITNVGAGYRNVKVTIAPPSSGQQATAVAILPPLNGHGFDPVSELFGNYVMMYTNVIQDEGGKFITGNDFRQVSIVRNPKQFSSNNALSLDVVNGIRLIGVSTPTENMLDKLVVGPEVNGVRAKAFVASVNISAGTIGIKQNDKTGYRSFQNNDQLNFYSDNTSTVVATTTATNVSINPDFNAYSGELIIVDNISKRQRSTNSEETFKVVIQY